MVRFLLIVTTCIFLGCFDNGEAKKKEAARKIFVRDSINVAKASLHIERVGKIRLNLARLGVKGKQADLYIDSFERKFLKADTLSDWYIRYKKLPLVNIDDVDSIIKSR